MCPPVRNRAVNWLLSMIIGEGGCGVVYVAEQEEPVRRRVALKVIKLGMDTKAVIAHPASGMRLTSVLRSTQATMLCLALATITGLNLAVAQVSFTRILEGEIAEDTGLSIGCAGGDYDNDGYPDLIVADAWRAINRLYHNNGDGTFSRVTEGTIANDSGDSAAAVWGDYDNDGDLDLFVTSFDPPRDCFYRNEGDGHFTKVSEGAWVTDSGAGVGAAWGDYDNDGYLDLFISNFDKANFLFHNNADGTFTQVTEGPVVHDRGRSCGCAWADYDNDGDLDLFVANGLDYIAGTLPPEPGFLYRNDGGTNHWLVCIEWPSGVTQVLRDLAVNQHLVVEEDPIPLVALSFSEGGGTRTTSLGAEKCCGLLTKRQGCPMFSPNIPVGAWAPRNNNASIDFGSVTEAQGGHGIDFGEVLEPLETFTVTGWLNSCDLRAGQGGNRIVYALTSNTERRQFLSRGFRTGRAGP
jgi:hypothetical protein